MKTKINFKIAFFLGLILILFYSCEREGKVEAPLPFGPSSLTVLLNVSPSQNVLLAGIARQTSTITATLKRYDEITQTYTGEANNSITFEICSASGLPINTGYFEGNGSIVTATTDANGTATVTYYGPLATEVFSDTTIYIWTYVSRAGKESISEIAPITIIQSAERVTLYISANPTVLNAGAARESSTITATLITAVGGTPLANWSMSFDIVDEEGDILYVGYFDSNEQSVTKVTDANGVATVTYYGPLALELPDLSSGDQITAYITATAWFGEVSVSEMVLVYIHVP